MSKLSLQAVLELTDKISKPIENISKKTKQLTDTLQTQRDALRKLNQTQADVTSFKRMSNALSNTRKELVLAQQKAQELAKAHQSVTNPTKSMTKELDKAKLAVKQLKDQERDRVQHIQRLRQSLSDAGISTKRLAQDERKLQEQIKTSVQALNRKKDALDKVRSAQRQYSKDQERLSKIQSMGTSAGMTAAAGTAAMVVPVKFAMDFESAMAEVKKTVKFDTPQEFKAMNDEVIRLSKIYPMAADGIASIFAAGGQSGIAKHELSTFAQDAIKMGVAFDVSAEEAGQAMSEMRVAFKLSQDQVRSLGDQINHLSNNTPQAAKKLLEITQRVGPLANLANLGAGEVTALGSSMVGLEPEVAATAIKKVIASLTAGASAPKSMQQAYKSLGLDVEQVSKDMQKHAPETIQTVLKAIRKLPKDQQVSTLTNIFGLEGIQGTSQLADNLDNLIKNFGLVGDATNYAGSMQKEYDERAKTSANNWQIFKNKLSALSITVGTTLLPSLNKLLEKVGNITDRFQTFASQHPVLVSNIGKVFVVVLALLATFSALSLVLVSLLGPMALLRLTFATLGVKGIGVLSFIMKIGRAFMWLGRILMVVGRFMLANPIILAITLIATAAYLIYRNWGAISQFFSDIWNKVSAGASALWQQLTTFFNSGIANITARILNWSPLGLFYRAFASVMSWFGVQLPSTFTGFGQMLMQGLANGIGNAVGAVVERAKAVAAKVTGAVKSVFGINSPSRVFTQFGVYNMQGLANGISGSADLPQRAMRSASQNVLAGFDTSVLRGFDTSSIRFDTRQPLQRNTANTSASSQPIVQTFNIYPSAGMDEKTFAQMVAQEVAKAQRNLNSSMRGAYSDLA